MALMPTLGLGLLSWYYAHTFSHRGDQPRGRAHSPRTKRQGEMALPSLGKSIPRAHGRLLSPTPRRPQYRQPAPGLRLQPGRRSPIGSPQTKTPEELAFERRLGGPVSAGPQVMTMRRVHRRDPEGGGTSGEGAGEGALAAWLRPSPISAVRARVLPTQRLLLPKGAFIDCTLETAIDSTLPGMTTCITATDTFGVDGRRAPGAGHKFVGETRGEVQPGPARVFVLWTEARTPTGVIVPLASPGTDELGRSGSARGGRIVIFAERFGAAILISVIDGAVQAEIASR